MRQATEMKQDVLALTSDEMQIAKMRNKLAEYAQRIGASRAPEQDPDTVYKHRLLSELLDKRIIDIDAWQREFAKYDWYKPHLFINAVAVIRAYNSNASAALTGGTGLR